MDRPVSDCLNFLFSFAPRCSPGSGGKSEDGMERDCDESFCVGRWDSVRESARDILLNENMVPMPLIEIV